MRQIQRRFQADDEILDVRPRHERADRRSFERSLRLEFARLIGAVTDAVLEEVSSWQARPLEAVYPLNFFDALRVKIRDGGLVRNKAVRIALGVRADGTKEILGLCLEAKWSASGRGR
jgi:transposase-like protein